MKEDMTMKTKLISYWVTTIFTALELLAGGVTDLMHGRTALVAGEPVAEVLAHLGYPVYLLTILGVLTLASWALRPQSRILGVLFPMSRTRKASVSSPQATIS